VARFTQQVQRPSVSAERIESVMALTVAGTPFPPSYCTSFRTLGVEDWV
jgi:hypothetical protein